MTSIELARFDMSRGQRFERHVHAEHQLAWASAGTLRVDVADRCWMLPTSLALWIPAGVGHVALAVRTSVMHGIYLDPIDCPLTWVDPTVVSINPLARQLISYLAGELAPAGRRRAEAVLLDVLRPATEATVDLPLPRDGRARAVADLLVADPSDQRGLGELGRAVGASPRTLLRLFVTETGLTFTQWRTQVRLHAALPDLADGHPVARVAARVGYATPSAFVAAFRRFTGHTPAQYFDR